MNDSSSPTPPQKGLSGLAIAAIGCGGLILLALILGGLLITKCSSVVADAVKNPARTAAMLMVKSNPDLELVSTNDAKGEITIKDKKTGEVTTMSFDQLSQGKFKVTDAKGRETSIDASAAGNGKMVVKGPDGETVISGNASDTPLPSWVPAYPGSTPAKGGMHMLQNDKLTGVTMAESTDPISKVKDFYDAKFKAAGFKTETTVMNIGGGDSAVVNASTDNGNQTVSVVINAKDGKTSISWTYKGPK